ncbi:MAG: TIGR04255 family protein [Flavobacteriales bacterium]
MTIAPLPPESTKLYGKAPAVEVIYNIRTALPEPVDVQCFLDVVKEELPDLFEQHQVFNAVQGAFKLKPDGTADSEVKMDPTGYRFVTADKTFVAHYLMQGLVLNYLPPYPGFADAMERLKHHWHIYTRAVGEIPMTALSLRYIDRIDIPVPEHGSISLNDYFPIAGTIPDGLFTYHCYQQHWLNDPESDIQARVIWSSLENKPGHYSFALDTEAILDQANIMNPEEAWARFNELHAWCWHVFNHSLTDKCKALFK